jgi:PTH1 family peptidyl-tRNA hydrolase
LGNPGREYATTRHNAGFCVVDAFAASRQLVWQTSSRFTAETARWDKGPGVSWLLVKPMTYMNDSGSALRSLADFYQVPPSAIVVVYDDLTIDLGRIKVSVKGSAGGHNGVSSLLEHLGDGFTRFRIGIGPKQPAEMDLKDFVLGKFTTDERNVFEKQLTSYIDGLNLLIQKGASQAMNQLNRRDIHDSED